MNNGKAVAIFKNINSDDYTEEEKIIAIGTVLNMETYNSISKNTILDAFDWLLNYALEVSDED